MPSPPALTGTHAVVPLPFKPTALNGISEKMIVSHHDNNYAGAVKNLNKAEQELARINADTPPFVVAGLRQSELTFRNSKTLHEAYFGNLGGDGKRSGAIEKALAEAYGASSHWEEHFRATGAGLGGGSGWVILGLSMHDGSLVIWSGGNHTQTLAFGAPLMALDMYEHAYQQDYGPDHAAYIDAFFKNVAWEVVEARYDRVMRALAVLG
jgi:Fe-Mn family superoxide dismutase